jgi:hypothetical protein
MKLIRAIVNDLAVFFNKELVSEIEALVEKNKELEKQNKQLLDWDDMSSNYIQNLKKYRDTTIETVRDLYKIHKDFYSLTGTEFFDWTKCFNNHWEKRLYDWSPRYQEEDKENLEVKEFGNFIVRSFPSLVKKVEKSFKVFKQIIVKLTKKTKEQEARIKYLESLCRSNLIGVNF